MDDDPGPCHGCQQFERCCHGRLACAAFALFEAHGASRERYNAAPKLPTRERYEALFGKILSLRKR